MANACTGGLDTGFIAPGHAKVAFLGVVQGITELLPISSKAHMRLVPAFHGWSASRLGGITQSQGSGPDSKSYEHFSAIG